MTCRCWSSVLAMCLVVSSGAAPWASAAFADLPEDCLGFVYTSRFSRAAGLASETLAELDKRMGNPAYVEGLVGAEFRNAELLGVDKDRPMAAMLVRVNGGPPRWVYIVSVKDAKLFAGAVGRGMKALGERDGVTQYQRTVFDRQAFRKAAARDRLDMRRFYVARRQCVTFVGGRGVCGDSREACLKVAGWVKGKKLRFRARVRGAVICALRASQALKAAGADEPGRRRAVLKRFHEFLFLPETAQRGGHMGATFQAVCQMALDLAEGVRDIHVGVSMSALTGVSARVSITPLPGSALERFVDGQTTGGEKLVRFVPAAAMACAAHNFRPTRELVAGLADLMTRVNQANRGRPIGPSKTRALRKALADVYVRAYRGPMAVAWIEPTGPPVAQIVEVFQVNDRKLALDIWQDSGAGLDPLRRVYGEMGLTSGFRMIPTTDNINIDGVAVAGLRMELDHRTVPWSTIQFMKRLFGGDIRTRFAVVKDLALVCAGGDSTTLMRRVIGLTKAPPGSLAESARYKAATRGASEDWNFMVYVSPLRIERWLGRFAALSAGAGKPELKGPGIGLTGMVRDRRIEATVVAPALEVIAALRTVGRARAAIRALRVRSGGFDKLWKGR